jgi:Xaa-Pro dipeptidase
MQLERFFGVAIRRGGDGALIAPTLDRDGVNAAPTTLEKTLYDAAQSNGLSELFAALDGAKRIGVEEDHLNFARSRALADAGFELVPATGVVMHLRAAKDAEEVEAVRRACAHIEAAYEELWAELRPGAVQAEVNARVAFNLSRRGATATEPHILFGPHAAEGHGKPDERVLQPGDLVVADISAQFDGFWGDLTRCAHAGPPSTGQTVPGRSSTRRTRRPSPSPGSAPPAATSTPRSARSSRRTRRSAPVCTAPDTRSAPRSTNRRS